MGAAASEPLRRDCGNGRPCDSDCGSPDGRPCGVGPSPSCSICAGLDAAPQGPVCKGEDEEVLVEPCSILEELGFLDNNGPSCGRGALPPSPARGGFSRRDVWCKGEAPFCVSPTPAFSLAPHVGSPSFAVCPAPLPHQESPPEPMPFDMPTPKPQPVIPEPGDPRLWTPPAEASSRPVPVALAAALAAVEVADPGDVTAEEEAGTAEDTPPKPLGFNTPPQGATAPARRPWSPGHRSPYRGGVLSLFTPSPPSPPRRLQAAEGDEMDDEAVKELSEDDQLALAITASLRECGPPASALAPAAPAPAPAPAATPGQADGHALRPVPEATKSLEQSPRSSPRFFPARRTLLSWRRTSRQMQSI